MNKGKEYIRVTAPDLNKLSEIILAAKGVTRTMAQFAEDSGINASSLSRRVNGKMQRPLSVDAINAIMDHKSPSCGFTKEDLIRANGMIDPAADESRYRNDQEYKKKSLRKERLTGMRSIIFNELYFREVAYRKVNHDEIGSASVLNEINIMKSGILLKMLESVHEQYWAILFDASAPDHDGPEADDGSEDAVTSGLFRIRMLAYYAAVFLTDAWEPEKMTDLKCSFVFCDEHYYNAFRKALDRAKIASNMTTILLDLNDGKIIKEEPVPGSKKHGQDQYFDSPLEEAELFEIEEIYFDPSL